MKIGKKTRIWLLGGAVVLLLVAAATLWIYHQLNQDTIKLGKIDYEMAFMSDRDGEWDIYLLDKEGQFHNLTAESSGYDYYPNFTFNGQQVRLFSTASGDVTPALVNVDGTGFKTQTMIEALMDVMKEGNTDWDPEWSPGGKQMSWIKVVPAMPPHMDLFVADANGENRIQITNDGAVEGMQAWSPDGTQLVYGSNTSGKMNTYKMTVADGTVTRLTDHDANDYQPVWSMDGSKMLVIFSFHKSMLDGVIEMSVMNADGSDLHTLAPGEVFTGDLTYSPENGKVAYVSNKSGHWHIYVMDADGSNVQQITEGDSNNLFPAWRPVPAQ